MSNWLFSSVSLPSKINIQKYYKSLLWICWEHFHLLHSILERRRLTLLWISFPPKILMKVSAFFELKFKKNSKLTVFLFYLFFFLTTKVVLLLKKEISKTMAKEFEKGGKLIKYSFIRINKQTFFLWEKFSNKHKVNIDKCSSKCCTNVQSNFQILRPMLFMFLWTSWATTGKKQQQL